MLLTLETCNVLKMTSAGTTLADWYDGINENSVTITYGTNCCTPSTVTLPNRYAFIPRVTDCSVEDHLFLFTLGIGGINLSQVASVSYTLTNLTDVEGVDLLTYKFQRTNSLTSHVNYTITDTDGNVYHITVTIPANADCDTEFILTTTYPDLPCGIALRSDDALNITYSLFSGDCDTCITNTCVDENCLNLLDCPSFPNAVYFFSIGEDFACIFIGCDFKCSVVAKYVICKDFPLIESYYALTLASELTAGGNYDCLSCSELCELYQGVLMFMNDDCPEVSTTNCVDPNLANPVTSSDCGCNK